MKLIVVEAVLLLSYCSLTDAWFSGGGGGGGNKGKKNGGKNKGTTVDVGVEASKGGGAGVSVGVKHKGDGWSGDIQGKTDSKGNWGAKAGVSIKLGKRSIDWNGQYYTVEVRADPCNFNVYDENRDGVISKDEMQRILGTTESVDELFLSLDMTTGDGRVEEDEFYFMAPSVIRGCDTGGIRANH